MQYPCLLNIQDAIYFHKRFLYLSTRASTLAAPTIQIVPRVKDCLKMRLSCSFIFETPVTVDKTDHENLMNIVTNRMHAVMLRTFNKI